MTLKRHLAFVITISALWVGEAFSYEVDPSTYLKLPKSCQSWYIDAPNILSSWQVTGMSFAGVSPPLDLKTVVGTKVGRMNHYCPVLVILIRLKSGFYDPLTPKERRGKLDLILRGLDYQFENGLGWSESNAWFKAEVLRFKGHVLNLMGEPSRAVSAYESAIESFTAYLPAYWELATMLEGSGAYERAINTLEEALRQTRTPGYTKRISDRIEKLRKLAARDGTAPHSESPTDPESPAPVGESASQDQNAG
jgi:tetratricopeptide (TPR) repeat protein